MSFKFKKGDRVRRIRQSFSSMMPVGSIWTVKSSQQFDWFTVEGYDPEVIDEYFELVEEKKEELPSFIKVIPATAERREILNHWTPDGHFLHIIPKGNCVTLYAHESHQSISKQKLHDLGQHLIEVSKWMEE